MMLLALSGCSQFESQPGMCTTYARALNKPKVQELLENWFQQFPRTMDVSQLQRNQTGVGYGSYYRPLGFDPALISMTPRAHVEFGIDQDGRVMSLYIVEKVGAAYIFDVDGSGFHSATLRSPRTEHVGVLCLTRETVD